MDRFLVVVNPTAGSGRAERAAARLRAAVADAGGSLTSGASAADTERIAHEAAARGVERLIVVGGEGTVQAAANGLRGVATPPVLGIVPGGNGNDLARALGLPREPVAALAVALRGAVRVIDAGLACSDGRERRFLVAGGVGFDAAIAARMAVARGWWQRGRAGYLLTTLDELRRGRNATLRMTLDDDRRIDGPVLFAAFANGPWYGGGMRISPASRLDDAQLDLCVVGDIAKLAALRQLPGLYRGRHIGHPAVSVAPFSKLHIDGDAALIHLDGEPFGAVPLEVTVEPGAVAVAVAAPRASGTVHG